MMRIAEIISSVALTIAALGLLLNWLQARKNAQQRRAEWIARIYARYLEDAGMAKTFQSIEYCKFVYDDNFHDSPAELAINKLLEHYETIAVIAELDALRAKELRSFRYQFLTVFENTQIKKYLGFLDDWFKDNPALEAPFVRARKLAKKMKQDCAKEKA